MAKKDNGASALYVPKLGEVVTFITPQQQRIKDCTVTRLFGAGGRVRVKGQDGNTYSGSLDQIEAQQV